MIMIMTDQAALTLTQTWTGQAAQQYSPDDKAGDQADEGEAVEGDKGA